MTFFFEIADLRLFTFNVAYQNNGFENCQCTSECTYTCMYAHIYMLYMNIFAIIEESIGSLFMNVLVLNVFLRQLLLVERTVYTLGKSLVVIFISQKRCVRPFCRPVPGIDDWFAQPFSSEARGSSQCFER